MYRKSTSIRQAPVFRHLRVLLESPCQFIIWMYEFCYIACCWFPTFSNILILPSQFRQIRFENYGLHCPKCRILVLLRYLTSTEGHKGINAVERYSIENQKCAVGLWPYKVYFDSALMVLNWWNLYLLICANLCSMKIIDYHLSLRAFSNLDQT